MGPREWDALAWWEQRLYLDGFEQEEIITRRTGTRPADVVSEKVRREGGTTITDRTHRMTAGMEPGELEAFGLTTRRLN